MAPPLGRELFGRIRIGALLFVVTKVSGNCAATKRHHASAHDALIAEIKIAVLDVPVIQHDVQIATGAGVLVHVRYGCRSSRDRLGVDDWLPIIFPASVTHGHLSPFGRCGKAIGHSSPSCPRAQTSSCKNKTFIRAWSARAVSVWASYRVAGLGFLGLKREHLNERDDSRRRLPIERIRQQQITELAITERARIFHQICHRSPSAPSRRLVWENRLHIDRVTPLADPERAAKPDHQVALRASERCLVLPVRQFALARRIEVHVILFARFELLTRGRIVDGHPNLAPRRRLREAGVLRVLRGVRFVDRAERHGVALDAVADHFRSYAHWFLHRWRSLPRCRLLGRSLSRSAHSSLRRGASPSVFRVPRHFGNALQPQNRWPVALFARLVMGPPHSGHSTFSGFMTPPSAARARQDRPYAANNPQRVAPT